MCDNAQMLRATLQPVKDWKIQLIWAAIKRQFLRQAKENNNKILTTTTQISLLDAIKLWLYLYATGCERQLKKKDVEEVSCGFCLLFYFSAAPYSKTCLTKFQRICAPKALQAKILEKNSYFAAKLSTKSECW